MNIEEAIESYYYWVNRCLAAEKYIEESPCDPDIYEDQLKAYHEWQVIKDSAADKPIVNFKDIE